MNSYNKLIHIFVLIENLYLFKSLVGYILVLIADLPVGHILVLIADLPLRHILVLIVDLYLYGGIRKDYRAYTYTEVPVGTFRAERCTLLSSYSLFQTLSYNCLTT